MVDIQKFSAQDIITHQDQLVSLLVDAVNGGASVNFIAPLATEIAVRFWRKAADEVARNERIVLVAWQAEAIAGSVQLVLAQQPNAIHRAEVQKLLVHSRYRRQGIGKALMTAVEYAAREARRSLLVLDTERNSPAERLYAQHGYKQAGIIPDYALNHNGTTYVDTVIFYRWLV
jgi:ribosomal protein S18 acetylase RimI-like enzyme